MKLNRAGTSSDVLGAWRERAAHVQSHALDCGHFLAEENPRETYRALHDFFAGRA